MVPIAYAVLHNFMNQEKFDDTFDNIGEAVPHVGKGSSSRWVIVPNVGVILMFQSVLQWSFLRRVGHTCLEFRMK